MSDFCDTVCAPATVPGAGAVSIVRVSGPDTFSIIDKVVRFKSGTASDARGYTLKYGEVPDVDQVVVSIFRAPHSYTGEDSAEISTHASAYVVGRILELLVTAGARMAGPGEFTRRAFVNGKLDLAQAEAVADLIASRSEASHRIALKQLKGAYSQELKQLRDKLLELVALMELELDFSEEDVQFADRSNLRSLLDETSSHITRLAESFRTGNAIRNGVPVAIVGAVNSGKSTLLNAFLGEDRAIVSDVEGTTRDTVEETMVLDGILYRFIDTAGLRETDDRVERIGIERARKALEDADVVIEVIDASRPSCVPLKVNSGQTYIRVSNKTDLSPALDGTVGISAKNGKGLDVLKRMISESQKGRLDGSETLVTNLRHYEALAKAGDSLSAARTSLDSGLPTELVVEDLRDAIGNLNEIFGDSDRIDFRSVTDLIFGRFCIGK